MFYQTGGTPPPTLAKPKKFGNFRFFRDIFRGDLKFLKYQSTCNEMGSVWYQEPVFSFKSFTRRFFGSDALRKGIEGGGGIIGKKCY